MVADKAKGKAEKAERPIDKVRRAFEAAGVPFEEETDYSGEHRVLMRGVRSRRRP